jgi:hypothetical protein
MTSQIIKTAPPAARSNNGGSSRGFSRRGFLSGAVAAGGLVVLPSGTKLAFAGPGDPAKGDVLVYLFMRGGADGLSIVPPVGLQSCYDLRIDGGFDITVSQAQALDLGASHWRCAAKPGTAPRHGAPDALVECATDGHR